MAELAELDSDDEKLEAYFEQTRQENNFVSQWSLYDVTDLDESVPFHVDTLCLDAFEITFPTNFSIYGNGEALSWLELWRAADFLIQASRNIGPVFIEEFEEFETGKVRLITGS